MYDKVSSTHSFPHTLGTVNLHSIYLKYFIDFLISTVWCVKLCSCVSIKIETYKIIEVMFLCVLAIEPVSDRICI